MNKNYRVLQLVLLFVALLLLLSFSQYIFAFSWQPLRRINLVSDLIRPVQPTVHNGIPVRHTVVVRNGQRSDFSLFQHANLITRFSADTSQTALNGLMDKLHGLKSGRKRKVRIAYLGDSMIEADLITQTLRKLLQKEFGGEGVGFVPVTAAASKIRTTIRHSYSDNWSEQNFKSGGVDHAMYISGHTFRGANAWVRIADQTIQDSTTAIEKSLICGRFDGPVSIVVADASREIQPVDQVNRIVVNQDSTHVIEIHTTNGQLPVYGLSFESESGVIVDNFSFRGVSGVEFAAIDSGFLHAIAVNNPYDLIVLQYGINQLFDPHAKNYSWYHKIMMPSIKRLKEAFPQTDFLLVSTADRAFRYGDEYKTAEGIDSLVKVQAALAFENNIGFYNLYRSMGGYGTIVSWANADPSLANKDYIHPNHRGAEILGKNLYEAILADYKKYKPIH